MRIIGVSAAHDSSVAIVCDGKVEGFYKEERYTRKKRDTSPFAALHTAIQNLKGPVDYGIISNPSSTDPINIYLEKLLTKILKCPVIQFSNNHHLSHAALAFYNSGFDTAVSIVIDRDGSKFDNIRESESGFICKYPFNFDSLYKAFWVENLGAADVETNRTLSALSSLFSPGCELIADSTMSIVKVYESATTLIGESPLENGKTMGLSAYGKNLTYNQLFINHRPIDNLFCNGPFVVSYNTTLLRSHLDKLTNRVDKENYQFYADYAQAVQKATQEESLHLIQKLVNRTGIKNVCITGGYGLNVVANEYYVKNLPDVNFYFEPLADDSGNSIGAAMALYREKTKDESIYPIENTFFHGTYENDKDIDGENCTENEIAELLVQQKVVAVFKGKAEGGPRSLGHRSILFDARNPSAKDIVNKTKNREWYRPFAGMVLEEDASKYFEMHHLTKSPFMTISFMVKYPEKIPGITHVDGSCRIQTVDKSIKHIYNLLTKFKHLTRCSVLLNTSFNLAGEPLVETVEDALRTFNNSSIDALWFPDLNKVIKK